MKICRICNKPVYFGKDGLWHHKRKKLVDKVMERLLGKDHKAVSMTN
jgi:hypothetical protein